MCPNTYISISLIQPHNNRDNDRPIRLYGVTNISVEDPQLRLQPEILLPQELRPGQEFTLKVKEKNHQEMNYTLAIVDEGLLSLTSFRTPDPFSAFYAREALGVKTWDFYDYIYGAYGARLGSYINKVENKEAITVLGMNLPAYKGNFSFDMLGFAVLQSLGIRAEDL